jgi:hypothetical protein
MNLSQSRRFWNLNRTQRLEQQTNHPLRLRAVKSTKDQSELVSYMNWLRLLACISCRGSVGENKEVEVTRSSTRSISVTVTRCYNRGLSPVADITDWTAESKIRAISISPTPQLFHASCS